MQFSEAEYFTTLKNGFLMEEMLQRHGAIMNRYDPHKRVALIVDEWGTWWNLECGTNPGFLYQQNTQRDALLAGLTLNIFNAHCDRVRMANIAQTVNVLQAMILTDGAQILLTPTYHIFEMWKVHQDVQLLPIHLSCQEYSQGEASIPAVSASASKNANGAIHLSLCHTDPTKSAQLSIELHGEGLGSVSGRILAADGLNTHNTFENSEALAPRAFTDFHVDGSRLIVQLPPASVAVLQIS
jgi:alpha-N-arabinofuranosidase